MYSRAEWILLCAKVNRKFCKGERRNRRETKRKKLLQLVKNFISLIISWLPACRRLLFPLFPFPRATKEIGDVCTQANILVVPCLDYSIGSRRRLTFIMIVGNSTNFSHIWKRIKKLNITKTENSVQNLENRENWNTIIWTSSSWEEVRKRPEESVLW